MDNQSNGSGSGIRTKERLAKLIRKPKKHVISSSSSQPDKILTRTPRKFNISTPINTIKEKSETSCMNISSNEMNESIWKRDVNPFEFYRKFGDYWNIFPKTDFVYYQNSENFNKEISPGIPMVPNMSRVPLSSFKRSYSRFTSDSDSRQRNSVINRRIIKTTTEVMEIIERRKKKTLKLLSYLLLFILLGFLIYWYNSKENDNFVLISIVEIFNKISEVFSGTWSYFLQMLPTFSIPYFYSSNDVQTSNKGSLNEQSEIYLQQLSNVREELLMYIFSNTELKLKDFENKINELSQQSKTIEERLSKLDTEQNQIITHVDVKIKQDLEFSLKSFESKIEELAKNNKMLKEEFLKLALEKLSTRQSTEMKNFDPLDLKTYINEQIKEALRIYDADKTGLPDYALQSSGAEVLGIRCTVTYSQSSPELHIFGLSFWSVHNSPEEVLKPSVMPGNCWPFVGAHGYLIIRLSSPIYVTGFTMEHTPKSISPMKDIQSAPKNFEVRALKNPNDENHVKLGSFTYLDNGENLQYFEAVKYPEFVGIVELVVTSNHGNPNYTCLYRFRVHGDPHKIE